MSVTFTKSYGLIELNHFPQIVKSHGWYKPPSGKEARLSQTVHLSTNQNSKQELAYYTDEMCVNLQMFVDVARALIKRAPAAHPEDQNEEEN